MRALDDAPHDQRPREPEDGGAEDHRKRRPKETGMRPQEGPQPPQQFGVIGAAEPLLLVEVAERLALRLGGGAQAGTGIGSAVSRSSSSLFADCSSANAE